MGIEKACFFFVGERMNGKRREERVEVIVVDMKNGLVGITLWYFRLICVMLMHLSYFFCFR